MVLPFSLAFFGLGYVYCSVLCFIGFFLAFWRLVCFRFGLLGLRFAFGRWWSLSSFYFWVPRFANLRSALSYIGSAYVFWLPVVLTLGAPVCCCLGDGVLIPADGGLDFSGPPVAR